MSRRARAFTVWAVLRALGRSGVADLVDGSARHAAAFADGHRGDRRRHASRTTWCSPRCARRFGSDERTADVTARLMADGTTWMSGSRWHGKAVLRVSVSNWSTTDDDVARSLDALRKAAAT